MAITYATVWAGAGEAEGDGRGELEGAEVVRSWGPHPASAASATMPCSSRRRLSSFLR